MHRTARTRALQVAAALVALLTARMVATDLSALHRGAQTFGASRAVVIARTDLDLGARVTAADVRTVSLPAAAVPPGSLGATGAAIGRTVSVPVLRGAAVADRALAPRRRGGLGGIVAPGHRAVRVTTTDGLRPEPGAVVDIFATLDSAGTTGDAPPTALVARAALVLDVDSAPAARGSGSSSSDARVGVVVMVTEVEASRLAEASARGALMLAIDPPESACPNGAPVSCRP